MKTFFYVVILISSIFLIISVLLQPEKTSGLGAIGGATEKIWGKNRSQSYEAVLGRLTTISAIVFMISALALAAIQ